LQDCSADSNADNSSNGIAYRPQTLVLQRRPATLTPTAPLTASIIRLVMSHGLFFLSLGCCVF
jgi:hypothetical protein